MNSPLRSLAWMIISALSFTVMASLVKMLSQNYSPLSLVFFRSFVSFLIFIPFIFLSKNALWSGNRKLLVLRGILGVLGLSCYFTALREIPLSIAAFLIHSSPIFVLVFGRIFLGEKLLPRQGLFFSLTLIGASLLSVEKLWLYGASGPGLYTLLALGGSVFAGAAYVTTRAATLSSSVLSINVYFTGIAAFSTLPWALKGDLHVVNQISIHWMWLLLLGVAASLAQWALTQGYKNSNAGIVSAMGLLSPIFTLVAGVVFFKESLSLLQSIGAILVPAGALGLGLSRQQKNQKLETDSDSE